MRAKASTGSAPRRKRLKLAGGGLCVRVVAVPHALPMAQENHSWHLDLPRLERGRPLKA
jgi:hypothetical protein